MLAFRSEWLMEATGLIAEQGVFTSNGWVSDFLLRSGHGEEESAPLSKLRIKVAHKVTKL